MKKMTSFLLAATIALSGTAAVYTGMPQNNANAISIETISVNEINKQATYTKDTKGFVRRMYNVILGREPDDAGLNNWTEKLNNHTVTAGDLIYGFFWSKEYRGKKKTTDEILNDCYRAMLDRTPDATGRKSWGQRLDVGMTPLAVCKGFVGSKEFKSLCASYGIKPGTVKTMYVRDENFERTYFVYRLYANCLGRTPDVNGLENWCKNLKNGTTGASIIKGFVFSNEYKNRVTENYEFVDMLYRTLLGRAADQNGAISWTNKLNYTNTREYVTNGFIFSNEFKGQCAKAGINVGNALPTKDETWEWMYNIWTLDSINDYRVKNGKSPLVTQQDIWERGTSVRAKDLPVKSDINYRPDGTSDTSFWENLLSGKTYCEGIHRFSFASKVYQTSSAVADYVYSYSSGWKSDFNNDNYDIFAVSYYELKEHNSPNNYFWYITLLDVD